MKSKNPLTPLRYNMQRKYVIIIGAVLLRTFMFQNVINQPYRELKKMNNQNKIHNPTNINISSLHVTSSIPIKYNLKRQMVDLGKARTESGYLYVNYTVFALFLLITV